MAKGWQYMCIQYLQTLNMAKVGIMSIMNCGIDVMAKSVI